MCDGSDFHANDTGHGVHRRPRSSRSSTPPPSRRRPRPSPRRPATAARPCGGPALRRSACPRPTGYVVTPYLGGKALSPRVYGAGRPRSSCADSPTPRPTRSASPPRTRRRPARARRRRVPSSPARRSAALGAGHRGQGRRDRPLDRARVGQRRTREGLRRDAVLGAVAQQARTFASRGHDAEDQRPRAAAGPTRSASRRRTHAAPARHRPRRTRSSRSKAAATGRAARPRPPRTRRTSAGRSRGRRRRAGT